MVTVLWNVLLTLQLIHKQPLSGQAPRQT